MKIFSFAFRNIGRNRQRTIVTIGAMAFAGFIMLFYASLMEGFLHTMERNIVGMDMGDIQIHAEGYRDNPDLYTVIKKPDAIIERLESGGFSASPRVYGFGLAASGSASTGIWLRGVDIRSEQSVTQIHKHVLQGSWLDDAKPKEVVIGNKLAKTLGIKVGNEVVVVSQASDGSIANDIFIVCGILKSVGEGIDRSGFFMTEKAFRDLMVMPESSHEIAVVRKDSSISLKIATDKAAGLAQENEVKNWRQLQPIIARMLDISDVSLIFMMLITYAAVGMVVLNAMLMSVFERIREFGIMKAIGISPFRLAMLIFTEAIIQSIAASIIAIAFGLPVSYYYQVYGIDLSGFASTATIGGIAIDPIWYCRITLSSVLSPIILLIVIAAVAVIYPAVKAAFISPVKAIHYR